MIDHHTWGHLKDDTPFASIFPSGAVPLKGILPITPREAGAPPCFLVPGHLLTDEQVQALAQLLWERWAPECSGPDEAAAYIRQDALPLRADWFTTVGTRQRIFL